MKRFGICPVIGAGTLQNSYRPSAADVPNTNSKGQIPTDSHGVPIYHFALVRAANSVFSDVLAVSNSYWFPDFPLDSKMSSMDPDARTAMNQSVQAFDMDGAGTHIDMTFYGDDDSFRDVMNHVGQFFVSSFSIDSFDVADVVQ